MLELSVTLLCADGRCNDCPGKCSKWTADPGETVLGRTGEDGAGVVVACRCVCHSEAPVTLERACVVSSHYVAWRGLVYRFDAPTQEKARAKALRWLAANGYPGFMVWTGVEASRGAA